LRNHDRRGRLAPVFLDFLDCAFDPFFRRLFIILDRVGKAGRFNLEGDRDGAHGRQDLRFAHVERIARGVRRTVAPDWRQAADGADFAVGVDIFAVNTGGVHRQVDAFAFGLQCHDGSLNFP
jgi:hypothetical protein